MAMTYFQNIHSLADLKKEYRRLALEHHPDKGGDTAIMQQVNTEFGRLFEAWKEKPDIPSTSTGYEYDYPGATAKEYTKYVYNEYRWKGRNYKGQHAPEIVGLVRAWLKETYPGYKFSVRRENCHSIHIRLMKAVSENDQVMFLDVVLHQVRVCGRDQDFSAVKICLRIADYHTSFQSIKDVRVLRARF